MQASGGVLKVKGTNDTIKTSSADMAIDAYGDLVTPGGAPIKVESKKSKWTEPQGLDKLVGTLLDKGEETRKAIESLSVKVNDLSMLSCTVNATNNAAH